MKTTSRLKLAFLSFAAVTALSVGGGVLYLESELFGRAVKRMISARSPQKLGVIGDFSHLKIYFFPPGIGIANPRIHIERENIANIPVEGDVEAKELRAGFAPFQMFSGILRVDELEVNGGAVQGRIFSQIFKPDPIPKVRSSRLSWKDLFQLQINGIHFVDTYLNVVTELPGASKSEFGTEFVVKDLHLGKARIGDREGLVSSAMVRAVRITPPPSLERIPFKEANQLQWSIEFTDQGLKLNPFTLDISGVQLAVLGEVSGNLLDEKSRPKLLANATLSGDLGTFFLANRNDPLWSGAVDAKGSVSVDLKDPSSTFSAKFAIEGTNLAFDQMYASTLRAEGEVDLPGKLIRLDSLEATDDKQPGNAGRLSSGRMDIPFELNREFNADLVFKNAGIHWLGGLVPKAVYPLEGALQGNLKVQFLPFGKSWRLRLKPDLGIHHFELTNQKMGEKRVRKQILRPALPLLLKGEIEIDKDGLDFKDLSLSLRKSQFKVSGGIRGDKGFEFTAKGPVDLSEVSEIAGNQIRGEGTLEARIHGSPDELLLDFDTALLHAKYLGLDFGSVKGRITYDDGISELRFTGIRANQRNTFYSLKEGFIDLSGSDDLHLPIEIHSGRVEDLSVILHALTEKISWFPSSLKGEIHGSVDVGGKVDTPRLIIAGRMEGSDWAWLGERFRRVRMDLGYDQGVYYGKKIDLLKSTGSLRGEVRFDSNSGGMDWKLESESLGLGDFDFFERLEIPARSRIRIRSVGSGKMGSLESETVLQGYDTEVKGERYQPSDFSLTIRDQQMKADGSLFGGQLSGQMKYSLIPKQPSSFRMDLDNLDFSLPLLVLNPKLVDDPELKARASGRIQLDFLSTQAELARGEVELKGYQLKKSGFSLELADPIRVPVQLGYFQLKPSIFRFRNSELTLQGEGRRGDVDFRLKGISDIAIVEMLTSAVSSAAGEARTDLQLHGPLKALRLDGQVDLTKGKVTTRWMQTPFEDVDGRILINRGRIYIESLDAYLGDEVFSMTGKIDTFTDRFPELDIRGTFDNNKIKMDPFDLIQGRGTLTLKGQAPPYQIGGAFELNQAIFTRSFSQDGAGTASRGGRFLPKDESKQSSSNLFELDFMVNANQGFKVKNEIVDAEFKGKTRLIGPPSQPRLLGEGKLIAGKVLFKDRPFIFESAKIEFDDPYQLNPKFSASAISEVNQYKIRVSVFGRASQWKAEFSSTPFLKENEIFAVLSSGAVGTQAGRFTTRDRTFVSQGEAASLILHSMDFSKDVQDKTGFQFDVEEAVDFQAANSIFRPQNLSDNIAAPKVVLKRNVGRNVSLSFGSTVGVGSRNQREVNAEYKLTPGVSMLGVWNNIEGVNTRESRTSFGLDLKFNRRFK
ncbi:MAG: translocation/assembly module TamB domain-containing protein [Bdellovibrionales bacterium]|nr:translocation/assembly module TamB domain-containing protein [Bdellovibrionales bacterium]